MALFRLLKALIWSQRKNLVWGFVCCVLICGWVFLRRDDLRNYFDARDLRDKERDRITQKREDIQRLEKQLEALLKGSAAERETRLRQYKFYSKPGEYILKLKPEDTSPTLSVTKRSSSALPPAF